MKKVLCFGALLAACGGSTDNPMDASTQDTSSPDVVAVPDAGKDAVSDASMGDANDASADDASDATSTDSGPDVVSDGGGWDPKSISGLALWLDANKGVTKNNQNQVSKWADQSGNANDASQATVNNQPVWTANVVNALPAIHFTKNGSGSLLDIADAASLQFGTGDFSIEVVARFDNNPSNGTTDGFGVLYAKVGQSSGIFFIANDPFGMKAGVSGAFDGNNNISAQSSYNDNKSRLFGVRRVGSSLELRVQSMAAATKMQQGNTDVSASGVGVLIGRLDAMNQSVLKLDGDIAEMVAVKGSISAMDLKSLESYLTSKYNL